MESSQEISPAPSASSKGLKAIAKARINRKGESSTSSIKEGDNISERGGVRNSVDSLLDRTRSRRTSLDDGLPAGPSNLSKLVPGRVMKKKKRREEAERAQKEAEEGRGRGADDHTATSALASPPLDNRSRSTLGDGEGSLVTFDSEPDSPVATKPSLTSHNSHIGYLTTSSPLIKTTAPSDGFAEAVSSENPEFQNPQYHKSNTLPTNASASNSSANLAPHHAATFDTRRGSQSPGGGSRSRGVSPGAKIKDVLTIGIRRKAESPPKSPDLTPQTSRNNSTIGDLMRKGRKSITLGKGSEASDSTTSVNVPEPVNSQPTSVKDVPSIVTLPGTPKSAGFEAPETLVTPPTPIDHRRASEESPSRNRPLSASAANPNIVVSNSGNMISHRRIRSDSASNIPSKLSQAMPPPMTPMAEEARTPGGTARTSSQGSAGGGFFSSVFSAAQNMTSTLTNTIANPTRSRSSTATNDDMTSIMEEVAELATDGADEATPEAKKPLAIDTLGSGELRLSHLGISTDSLVNGKSTNESSHDEKAKTGLAVQRDEAASRAEDASAARAVSAAYSEKPIGDTVIAAESAPVKRSMSTYAPSIATETGERTPPTGSIYEGADSIRRSGSVRSRVGVKVRRHRNSSSATGNTMGTTIMAGERSPGNQPTGFAVASKKRNREFHQLFKSVPEEDFLIEDYSCALQREIILAGRIYISESHICFSSNILGWITTLVISFSEVVLMEKENTAVVFPNAIAIQTLHARHTFRSLLSRDASYELLIGIWKLTHPNLKNSGTSARLAQDADKLDKNDPNGDDISELSDEEEVYDEDQEDEEGTGSPTENGGGSVTGSLAADDVKATSRKASAMGLAAGSAAVPAPIAGETKAAEKALAAGAGTVDFPGPSSHAPTECPDTATHYDKELRDDIIAAPLGKVYSMVFGSLSGGFMARWLVDDMKCTNLEFEDEAKKGLSQEVKSRSMSYIKPLYAPIGPKTTKCLVTETIDFIDLEKAVCVTASTQTPDVPSGNVFVTKTHFCFMWAANNATRLVINYTIEWTGKSWLKGPIEKGATDGQTTYCVELVKALKAGISSPRPKAGVTRGKTKPTGKRRKRSASTISKPTDEKTATKEQGTNWGPLEPLHGILSPVTDIFAPFISANMIIGFLLFIMFFNYLRSPSKAAYPGHAPGFPASADRAAAYEELWRREEADLWDWLDQRIGVKADVSTPDNRGTEKIGKVAKGVKQQIMRDVRMTEREVESAIKATEEKLEGLKKRVIGNKDESQGNDGTG